MSTVVSLVQDLLRQSRAALRLLVAMTVLLGVLYPATVWALGRTLGDRAAGQPVRLDDRVVGSRLLAQSSDGPAWFHPRPSAGDHDTLASGPSNLGPRNPALADLVAQRRAVVAATEGVSPAEVPADAVTASGSGLDPHISPEYAQLQVDRVARERHLDPGVVQQVVAEHTQARMWGFLGEPVVNVLELNLALLALSAAPDHAEGRD